MTKDIVAWAGFIFIVILVCEWFFRTIEKIKRALTNITPSVEADVQVLMVGGDNPNARTPNAERVNVYDRYAATHEVIQHRNAKRKGG